MAAQRKLLTHAAIEPGHRILDIGCTGTLAVLARRLYADAAVVGLDPDPRALARRPPQGAKNFRARPLRSRLLAEIVLP